MTHSTSGTKAEADAGVIIVNIVLDGLDEDKETEPGTFLGYKKRKLLSLNAEPKSVGGSVLLTMNNDLKLYDAVTDGNEITVREWNVNNIPNNLYVEGTAASNAIRDKECKLTWKNIDDIVKVTVIKGNMTPDSLFTVTNHETVAEVLYYIGCHAAKRRRCSCGSPKWVMFESKCGNLWVLEHLSNMGGQYGTPIRYYKK